MPTNVDAICIVVSISLMRPKSEIFTSPVWLISRFDGLMSRWICFLAWMNSRPWSPARRTTQHTTQSPKLFNHSTNLQNSPTDVCKCALGVTAACFDDILHSVTVASSSDTNITHTTRQHSTAQHSTAQHSTAQHSTAQHSTAQHSTAHYALYSTVGAATALPTSSEPPSMYSITKFSVPSPWSTNAS